MKYFINSSAFDMLVIHVVGIFLPCVLQILLCRSRLKNIFKFIPAAVCSLLFIIMHIAFSPEELTSGEWGPVHLDMACVYLFLGVMGMLLGYVSTVTFEFLKKSVTSMKKAAKEKKALTAAKERERY